jgi:hypothetical protein
MESDTAISKLHHRNWVEKNLVGGNFIIANITGNIKARKINCLVISYM